MTNQEIFTKAWVYAISMTDLAMDMERSFCMYRTPDGNRCLIGHFIPDGWYAPAMENMRIGDLCTTDKYMSIFFDNGLYDGTDARLHFLDDLQNCHDSGGVATVQDMLARLREFAEIHSLIVPE